MFTELPAGHVTPPTVHSGDDELVSEDANYEPSRTSQAELYAMPAPYLGVSFYVSDEEERTPVTDGGGGRHDSNEEEYMPFPPPSPEAILRGYEFGDYWSSPRCSCTLRTCRWRHRDRDGDEDGCFSAKEELVAAPAPGNVSGGAASVTGGSVGAVCLRQVEVLEEAGELIGEEEDTSYDADSECECGGARCATRRETMTAAAATRRNSEASSIVARLTAVAAGAVLVVRRLVCFRGSTNPRN